MMRKLSILAFSSPSTLPRVLEEFYTDMSPGALQLADAFGFGRDDSRLEELVLELHSKVQSHA